MDMDDQPLQDIESQQIDQKILLKRYAEQIFSCEDPNRSLHVVRLQTDPYRKKTDYIEVKEVYKCFKRFGAVESVRSKCADCAYVQFKDYQIAAKLIRKGRIEINGIQFEIKPLGKLDKKCAHYKTSIANNVVDPLLKPPEMDSPKHILNALDDNCLHEIFDKLHDFTDFTSVAMVCERFNKIAMEVFPSKIKSKKVRLDDLVVNGNAEFSAFRNFFKMFGSSIGDLLFAFKDLNLNNKNVFNYVMELVEKYCPNIHTWTIVFFKLNEKHVFPKQSLCSKIKSLTINFMGVLPDGGLGTSLKNDLSHCTELERLTLFGNVPEKLTLPEQTFPKLIEFQIAEWGQSRTSRSIHRFLAKNVQLEDLTASNGFEECGLIGRSMKNLKELDLFNLSSLTEFDVMQSRHINNINLHLSLHTNGDDVHHIRSIKSIKVLRLYTYDGFDESHLFRAISENNHLEKLTNMQYQKNKWITSATIKRLLQKTPHLSELIIGTMNPGIVIYFDETDYQDILEIVRNRKNQVKLRIRVEPTEQSVIHSANNHKLIMLNSHPELTIVQHYAISQDTYTFGMHLGVITCMTAKIALLALMFL